MFSSSMMSYSSVGMMGGAGTSQSAIGMMQGVLSGGATGSTTAAGLMRGMLDVMDDFLPSDFPATNGGPSAFQTMASAMNLVLTGSSDAPATFQTMLSVMHAFLSDAASGSSNAATSFQAMLNAMNAFLPAQAGGSATASGPFGSMLEGMQAFLSSTASGSSAASGSFQAMLGSMQSILTDATVLSGPASAHVISGQANGGVQVTGTDGIAHMLTNMDRLHFSDESVAMDLGGNAGMAAKTLGLVFGADAVHNKAWVGTVLGLIDGGMSYQDVMQAALNLRLGTNFSTADEVNLIYQNLAGLSPGASDMAYWSHAVASGQFTLASLAVMAADTGLNTDRINLVGLAHTGLEYLPAA
jgi:hypothetical protein